jgi:hypothetical protein
LVISSLLPIVFQIATFEKTTRMPASVHDLLQQMDAEHIVVAYNGPIDEKLLEEVYAMMDRHMEERNLPKDKRKKLYHVLIESLQNVFHHHLENAGSEQSSSGFVIRYIDDIYTIITGNNVNIKDVPILKERLEKVNSLSQEDLRAHYLNTLSSTELSEKGGAGLGIIEMARKSGNKLKYEFTKVNGEFSFFTLEVTI